MRAMEGLLSRSVAAAWRARRVDDSGWAGAPKHQKSPPPAPPERAEDLPIRQGAWLVPDQTLPLRPTLSRTETQADSCEGSGGQAGRDLLEWDEVAAVSALDVGFGTDGWLGTNAPEDNSNRDGTARDLHEGGDVDQPGAEEVVSEGCGAGNTAPLREAVLCSSGIDARTYEALDRAGGEQMGTVDVSQLVLPQGQLSLLSLAPATGRRPPLDLPAPKPAAAMLRGRLSGEAGSQMQAQ